MPSLAPLFFASSKAKPPTQSKKEGNSSGKMQDLTIMSASAGEKGTAAVMIKKKTTSPSTEPGDNPKRRLAESMASIEDDDDRLLAQIGYTQVRSLPTFA